MTLQEEGKRYLRQKDLAERWQCVPGTIINYRKKGLLKYFRLPGSTNIYYYLDEVEELERNHTKNENQKGGDNKKKAEIKEVKPCVSSPKKEWRI